MIIKRRTIIKAIRDNDLVAGKWIGPPVTTDFSSKLKTSSCTTCLVGAVVLKHYDGLVAYHTVAKLESFIDDTVFNCGIRLAPTEVCYEALAKAVNDGHYIAALSHLFEGHINELAVKTRTSTDVIRLRKKDIESMITWVKKHIPVQFEVSI